MSYPEVKIVGIDETPDPPKFKAEVIDLTNDVAVEEVMEFYRTVMIPQLACNEDGSHPAFPSKEWITNELSAPRTLITIRSEDDVLYGVWIVREGQILYPCANNDFIALVYRELWDETIKRFDHVWAYTSNVVMQGFIKKAKRNPPLPSTPTVVGDKIEWYK